MVDIAPENVVTGLTASPLAYLVWLLLNRKLIPLQTHEATVKLLIEAHELALADKDRQIQREREMGERVLKVAMEGAQLAQAGVTVTREAIEVAKP